MHRVRFIMLGGFLGAGKTTAIARLARHYLGLGLRVGLVTNDQAYGLVDTQSLRAQGFDVGEVTGACFCCKFNDLVDTAARLSDKQRPDVIIAEPVGSCTDLAATVIEPLRRLYGERYDIAPLAVLLKPEHGRKILGGESGLGFSPKAAYIFLKQLEESEVVAINKIDQLDDAGRARLVGQVRERFPGKEVLTMSARRGDGFESLVAALDRPAPRPLLTLEVDYDTYAEGEAELGWLNSTVRFGREQGTFDMDKLLLSLVRRIAHACSLVSAEPAHLKVLGMSGGATAIANLVSSDSTVELSVASGARTRAAEFTVNARIAVDPDILTEMVAGEAAALAKAEGLTHTMGDVQCFRPGRPVPTHRMPVG